MIYESQRTAVCEYAIRMWKSSMVVGSAGNISMRTDNPEHFVITPSSVAYEALSPEQVMVVDEDADLLEDLPDGEELDRAPSFETPIHLAVYAARDDVGAVVHTHSKFATILAVLRRPIPPVVDEMVVYLGGQVEVARYAQSGSDELAAHVVDALGPRAATLLAAHGALTVGKDLTKAFKNAELLEHVAEVVVTASQLGEPLRPLPEEIIAAERQMYDIVKSM